MQEAFPMVEQIFSKPDIFIIPVPLPNNPLRNLNCYVLRDGDDALVIDTGFNMVECMDALSAGLKELGVDMGQATLFLTHLHSDHVGLAAHIIQPGTRVLMGELDYGYMRGFDKQNSWSRLEELFCREGLPREEIELQRRVNPARAYAPERSFDAETVTDGFIFQIGSYHLRCVWTPGHTPGHMCLYLEEEKILFSGDHILFDITPNITMWPGIRDSLGNYLESLKRVSALEIRAALPAHRHSGQDAYARIRDIQEHHDRRLNQILDILREEPGLDACGIGSRMTWSMRGKNWSEFPIQQKWFAIGETISHLDYLLCRKQLVRREAPDHISYFLSGHEGT